MIVVGIDPGLKGAIAWTRNDEEGAEMYVRDMPIATRQQSNGKLRRYIDPTRLARLLSLEALNEFDAPGDALVFIERAQSSRGMSPVAAFNYGEGFGLIIGVLAHLGAPYRLVTPLSWKRDMGLTRKGKGDFDKVDKHRSLEKARKLYPGIAPLIERRKDDGRAEAMLIAHWGCEQIDARGAA